MKYGSLGELTVSVAQIKDAEFAQRAIYTASSAEAALAELDAFALVLRSEKFPTVAAAWRRAWDRACPA